MELNGLTFRGIRGRDKNLNLWAFGVSDGLGGAGFIWRMLVDVALENMGSMWLLEEKHTDPSIGFLGVGITVASPELFTHWAVFSQPHFWNIRVVFTVFREKLCLGGFCSPGVSKLLCAASKQEAEPGTQVYRKLLRQAALAPVLGLASVLF